jgi:hypothetical protein
MEDQSLTTGRRAGLIRVRNPPVVRHVAIQVAAVVVGPAGRRQRSACRTRSEKAYVQYLDHHRRDRRRPGGAGVLRPALTVRASSRRSEPDSWLRLGAEAWLLGIESANVVTLRMLRVAAGGASAKAEARRMLSEKITAAWMLQSLSLLGLLGHTAPDITAGSLRHYRKLVRANRRRLERRSKRRR